MMLRFFLLLILLLMSMSNHSIFTVHSLPGEQNQRIKRGVVWDFLQKVSTTKNLVVDVSFSLHLICMININLIENLKFTHLFSILFNNSLLNGFFK